MQRFTLFTLVSAIMFCAQMIFFIGCKTKVSDDSQHPLYQTIIERSEHEYNRVKEPGTGLVPTERLFEAQKVINRKLSQKDAIPNINWEERGPQNVAGRTRSILIDSRDPTGNFIWTGGVSGGLWKSTNGGVSWTAVNHFYNNLAVTSVVQDPNNSNIIYFGTGEMWAYGSGLRGAGIYKSTDGGISFAQIAFTVNNKDFEFINRLAIHSYNGTTHLYAATGSSDNTRGGLYITQNGGTSWLVWKGNNTGVNNFASDVRITAPDPQNGNNAAVIAAFGGGNTYFPTESDGIYVSLNGGNSWFKEWSANSNEGRIELAIAPSDPYIRYMLCESKDPNILPTMYGRAFIGSYQYVPISLPLNWKDLSCTTPEIDMFRGQDFYDLAMAVSPINPYVLFVGGVDLWAYVRNPQIFSDQWTQISHWAGLCNLQFVHADQHAIQFANVNTVYVANDGGIFKSENVTTQLTFGFRGNGLNITQLYSADLHPSAGNNEYVSGTQDNGSPLFRSAGMNNTVDVSGGDGGFSHVDQLTPNIQITSNTNQNYTVTNTAWANNQPEKRVNTTGGRFINPTDYDDVAKKLYCVNGAGNFTRWENPATLGETLTTVSVTGFPMAISDPRPWHVRVSPNVANRVYFGFDNGVVARVDGANTGSSKTAQVIFNLNLGSGRAVSCVEIERGNENHILVTLSNYGVTSIYESFNGNSASPTWQSVEGNLPDMPVRWAMFNPNNSDQALIATELGVWSTTNLNGNSTDWDPTNAGLSNTRVDMLKYRSSDKQVIAATHGRGLFTTNDFMTDPCDNVVSLNGLTLGGNYTARQSINSVNTIVSTAANFLAPEVIFNPSFTVNSGVQFMVSTTGCN